MEPLRTEYEVSGGYEGNDEGYKTYYDPAEFPFAFHGGNK